MVSDKLWVSPEIGAAPEEVYAAIFGRGPHG